MLTSTIVFTALKATRTWRPSSPGTTRPSDRPSSGRYDCSRNTPVTLAALFWRCVPPPAGLRHPLGAAAGHGRHRGPLFLLVTPLLKELVYSFVLAEMVIWLILHLQHACEVLHPDPSWPVHGILVSEIKANTTFFGPFWRLIYWSDCSLMFFATYIALSCCGELRWTFFALWITQLG